MGVAGESTAARTVSKLKRLHIILLIVAASIICFLVGLWTGQVTASDSADDYISAAAFQLSREINDTQLNLHKWEDCKTDTDNWVELGTSDRIARAIHISYPALLKTDQVPVILTALENLHRMNEILLYECRDDQ